MTDTPELSLELDSYRNYVLKNNETMLALTKGLSTPQFNWRPDPRAWSIGQCLDHLNILHTLLVPKFQAAIEQGHTQKLYAPGPFRYGWLGKLFIYINTPPGFKIPTPSVFEATESATTLDPEVVVDRFLNLQGELVTCIENANGLDLTKLKVSSPAMEAFKLSFGIWLKVVGVHGDLHLQQAQRVKDSAGFPDMT